jgi:hypothetical protein
MTVDLYDYAEGEEEKDEKSVEMLSPKITSVMTTPPEVEIDHIVQEVQKDLETIESEKLD